MRQIATAAHAMQRWHKGVRVLCRQQAGRNAGRTALCCLLPLQTNKNPLPGAARCCRQVQQGFASDTRCCGCQSDQRHRQGGHPQHSRGGFKPTSTPATSATTPTLHSSHITVSDYPARRSGGKEPRALPMQATVRKGPPYEACGRAPCHWQARPLRTGPLNRRLLAGKASCNMRAKQPGQHAICPANAVLRGAGWGLWLCIASDWSC